MSSEQASRIATALNGSQESCIRLIQRSGYVDQQVLAVEVARFFDLPQTSRWPHGHVLPDRISARFLREHRILPLAVESGVLHVAVSDPTDLQAIEALRIATEHDVSLSVATDSQIISAIEKLGSEEVSGGGNATEISAATADDDETVKDLALNAPVIDLVNRLFRESSSARATDLHIEPARGRVIVRRRVDGMLKESERLQPDLGRAAVARIKILTHLNIAERRLPQDGRARVRISDSEYDIRVATMPTIHGESIAIRFLSASTQVPDLSGLGLVERDLAMLKVQAASAHGMIAVTGPTGSGKTTTLAGVLDFLNDPTRKIVTIEDPVEYQVEGVNQIQVHPEIGLTFARTLRSLLRLDPDIIMVGEMRDNETANIGVNAALTGHLVLTTLHTNSAVGAITRLLDLGVQAYLIASTLRCAVAQRLVRRLCSSCKQPYEASSELVAQLPVDWGWNKARALQLWKAVGCEHCGGTGFLGRSAIFEVLIIDDRIRRLIRPDTGSDVLAAAAREGGMTSMLADGFLKCRQGVTTIEELGRVAADN